MHQSIQRNLRRIACTGLLLALQGCAVAGQPRYAGPGDGVRVEESSSLRNMVPAEQLEQSAAKSYNQLKAQAGQKGTLLPPDAPASQRVQAIARRLLPQTAAWNPAAKRWKWEVVVLKSDQLNAFCMPGGKIAVYTGLIDKLKLSDDEIAMVMGHEMAHALMEHSREQMAKSSLMNMGADIVSSLLGAGQLGRQALGMGTNLVGMKFSRDDETEADLVGLDMASRSGYDPRSATLLWRKMQAAAGGGQIEWMSTHPSGSSRIQEINNNLGKVLPLYAKAIGKTLDTLPPDPNFQ